MKYRNIFSVVFLIYLAQVLSLSNFKSKKLVTRAPPESTRYILKGYHAPFGNPHANQVDPGFVEPLFVWSVDPDDPEKVRGIDKSPVDSC